MSTSTPTTGGPSTAAPTKRRLQPGLPFTLLVLAGVILLFSIIRVVSGADDIDSSGTLGAGLGLAVPIALAGLGGLWAERAGVVNIGLEGMMILGTFGAGWAGYQWGAWAGVGMAVVMGALGGLLHALATVTFGVDHIVSGVAINILAVGVAAYLAELAFTGVKGGGSSQSPTIPDLPAITISALSDPLLDVEKKGWFLISDLASFARALVNNVSVLTLIAILLLVGTYYVLWRTAFGLRLRSCGESPYAAESLGVKVLKYKYYAVVASGAFAGLGGAFLAIVAQSQYRDGQTGGRGYIGLAAMIFGNWRPGGLAGGAGLFGYTDALRLRRGEESVHALLLVVGLALLALAAWQVRRTRVGVAVVAAIAGAAVISWYASTDTVPGDFTVMTPYITTLLVLALASQRLRMPAADGLVYRKGEGG